MKDKKNYNAHQRLFNVLHELGLIATESDMQSIINAIQVDGKDMQEYAAQTALPSDKETDAAIAQYYLNGTVYSSEFRDGINWLKSKLSVQGIEKTEIEIELLKKAYRYEVALKLISEKPATSDPKLLISIATFALFTPPTQK